NWQKLTKDRWVLNTVLGYKIEFISEPCQYQRPFPTQLNQDQQKLVSQEITEMISKGAVLEIQAPQEGSFFSTLFLVPNKDDGQRPVINLKNLNSFINAPHFTMEGIHTLKSLLRKGDWLEFPVFPIRKQSLPDYQFNCLPFSLASAPWVFTKTLKLIAALGQELGIQLAVYIDNILLMAETKEKASDHASGLIHLFQCPGFTINLEKTILQPSQCLEFLGFMVDTIKMKLSLPTQKKKDSGGVSTTIGDGACNMSRPLKVNWQNECHKPAPLFYRSLQIDLASALREGNQDYETTLALSPNSKEELIWWDTQMINWNGKMLLTTEPDLIIESDASTQGWGASHQGSSTGGPWSPQERECHTNCLELLAVTLVLKTLPKTRQECQY
uniref:Reverse transcriptase domain-containing protein n=1 Tax=Amphimedon queenslandica TaxID=400682 RepID=A0A1X7TRB5_AMPQE